MLGMGFWLCSTRLGLANVPLMPVWFTLYFLGSAALPIFLVRLLPPYCLAGMYATVALLVMVDNFRIAKQGSN